MLSWKKAEMCERGRLGFYLSPRFHPASNELLKRCLRQMDNKTIQNVNTKRSLAVHHQSPSLLKAVFCESCSTVKVFPSVVNIQTFHCVTESRKKKVLFTKATINGKVTRWIWLMRSQKFSTFNTALRWCLTVRSYYSFGDFTDVLSQFYKNTFDYHP